MKILVAIDGSKDAAEGVRMGLDMAQAKGAEVTLLAVIPIYPDIDLEITARARDSLERKLGSQAEESLSKAKESFQAKGISPRAVIINAGDIADEIVKMAEDEKMDLIVIGSRGLGATGRFSLGGTAMKIISHAPCSVLVAKAAIKQGPENRNPCTLNLFLGIELVISTKEGLNMPGSDGFIVHDHVPLSGTAHQSADEV